MFCECKVSCRCTRSGPVCLLGINNCSTVLVLSSPGLPTSRLPKRPMQEWLDKQLKERTNDLKLQREKHQARMANVESQLQEKEAEVCETYLMCLRVYVCVCLCNV